MLTASQLWLIQAFDRASSQGVNQSEENVYVGHMQLHEAMTTTLRGGRENKNKQTSRLADMSRRRPNIFYHYIFFFFICIHIYIFNQPNTVAQILVLDSDSLTCWAGRDRQ